MHECTMVAKVLNRLLKRRDAVKALCQELIIQWKRVLSVKFRFHEDDHRSIYIDAKGTRYANVVVFHEIMKLKFCLNI